MFLEVLEIQGCYTKASSFSAGHAKSADSYAPPKNRIYVMMQAGADIHPDVITSTFLVNNTSAYVLFDTRGTVYIVASSFVRKASL